MNKEVFEQVLTHLDNCMKELYEVQELTKKDRFSIIETILDKLDEAKFRWNSRL